MTTHAKFVATDYNKDNNSNSKIKDDLEDYASYTKKHWANNIEDGSDEYKMYEYADIYYSIQADSDPYGEPDTIKEALVNCRDYISNHTRLFDYYDCVIVDDDRNFDPHGIAYIGTAGGTSAVGYIDSSGDNYAAAHELGHVYNGDHGDDSDDRSTFESTEFHRSILGCYGCVDCNDSTSYTSRGDWYADCTVDAVRSYIDNNEMTRG